MKKFKEGSIRSKLMTLAASLLILIVVILLAVVFNLSNNNSTNSEKSNSSEVTQTDRSISGKSADEDRKDALAAATAMLNEASKSPVKDNLNEKLTKLDNGDFEVVTPELKEMVRFKDIFSDSKELKANTYQSLLTLSALIEKSSEAENIEPNSDVAWKNVYVDSEAGIAFVPLTTFVGDSPGFSFEMVYTEGEWKLSPYSLLDTVRLSARLSGGDE